MQRIFRIRFGLSFSENLKSQIQNRKWAGIVAIAVAFAMCGAVAQAQQPKKVPRVGFLLAPARSAVLESLDAFRQGLRELGYVEGQSIVIEYRYAEGKFDRLPDLAAELVRLNVDVIVAAGGTLAIKPAKNVTSTIPIVMTGAIDPITDGLISSLAKPGGNVTGLTLGGPELYGKRLSFSRKRFPKSRVWLSSGIGQVRPYPSI